MKRAWKWLLDLPANRLFALVAYLFALLAFIGAIYFGLHPVPRC